MKRYEILCDEKHLFISVIGSYVRRELTIPIGALLTDRHGGRPKLLGLFSDGRIAEAALAEMKVCGYRVVSGKLSPLCVSPTSKTDCVTRMRDAGIAARKAA